MSEQTETFARRARQERLHAGLSQSALADLVTEAIGRAVDHSAIAKIEKHQRRVSLDEALAITEALDVPLDFLLRDRDAVDEEIGELRQALAQEEYNAAQARDEAERAAAGVEGLRERIARLEVERHGE